MGVAELGAIVAVIIAIIALGWNVVNERGRSRRRVDVYYDGRGFRILNYMARPLNISGGGLVLKNGERVRYQNKLGEIIQISSEMEDYIIINGDDVLHSLSLWMGEWSGNASDVDYAYVVDITGHEYKHKIKNINAMEIDFKIKKRYNWTKARGQDDLRNRYR